MTTYRRCRDCRYIFFSVSRAKAEAEIERFNEYYESIPKETQDMFLGPASMANYDRCYRCGLSYLDFEEADPKDAPMGCTLNPILEKEKD